MSVPINVNYGPSSIGQIIFDEAPHELTVAYSDGGFRITLPANLRLAPIEETRVIPMVSNLRGMIYGVGESGERLDLGEIRDGSYYTGTQGEYSAALNLIWIGPLATKCGFIRPFQQDHSHARGQPLAARLRDHPGPKPNPFSEKGRRRAVTQRSDP